MRCCVNVDNLYHLFAIYYLYVGLMHVMLNFVLDTYGCEQLYCIFVIILHMSCCHILLHMP